MPWIVTAAPSTARDTTTEDEPNESAAAPDAITFDGDSASIGGRLATQPTDEDSDLHRLTIDSTLAGRLTDIRLLWQGGTSRTLCLTDTSETQLRCTSGEQGLSINDLVLVAGDYLLQVSGLPAPNDPYVLKVDVTGEAVEGFEAEPNEDIAHASPLVPEGDSWVSSGRSQVEDSDFFGMTVAGEPQLWLIEATGDGLTGLSLVDANGSQISKTSPIDGVAAIYDAFLLPGDHGIVTTGEGGDYTIKVTPLGPPDPQFEHEPNDSKDRSQPLKMLEERTGRLATTYDYDFYRFSLQNETSLDLAFDAPDDAMIRISLDSDSAGIVDLRSVEAGDDLSWNGMLPAGDYVMAINATAPSADPYALRLTPLDPFELADDLEPNDIESRAAPIPDSMRVSGELDPTYELGDVDWYALPAFPNATQVVFTYTPEVTIQLMTVGDAVNPAMSIPLVLGTEAGGALGDVPADTPFLLQVSGTGSYEVTIETVDDQGVPHSATPVAAGSTLTSSLDLGEDSPAAYWTDGQVVEGTLTITNDGDAAVDLDLSARTGQAAWTVTFDEESVTVDAGESLEIPVAVHVAPDSWADQSIYIAVLSANDELATSAMGTVTPSRSAPPLNVEAWSPLPEQMLGGLDVAWTSLGATPVAIDETVAAAEAPLYDQMLNTGFGQRIDASLLPVELTIDLAGDDPVPVTGIILFPLGPDATIDTQLKGFDLELSLDGQTFTPVLSGELTTQGVEQSFALDEPVEARFARLRVRSAQLPTASIVSIGEWKVVADPAWAMPDTTFNLADPTIGGHVVNIDPPTNENQYLQLLLTPDGDRQTVEAGPDANVSIVLGFHNDRAARITDLEWLDPPGSDPATRFDSIVIETSEESPIGPWTSLGEFALERDSSGKATVEFEAPVWARFLRITGVGTGPEALATPAVETFDWELPEQIIVHEQQVDADYRTILGEWGTGRSDAIYEQLVQFEPIHLDEDAGNDASSATLLPLGSPRTDFASIESDEDWYRIEVPEGDGTLTVSLSGIPALGVKATLYDEDNVEIPVSVTTNSASSIDLAAEVEPGATYLLRVTQPPTSVVFAFDTSFSIGPLEATVYQGLIRFAGDVQKDREFVNILPFGETLAARRLDRRSLSAAKHDRQLPPHQHIQRCRGRHRDVDRRTERARREQGDHPDYGRREQSGPGNDVQTVAGARGDRAAHFRGHHRGKRRCHPRPGPDAGLVAGQQWPASLCPQSGRNGHRLRPRRHRVAPPLDLHRLGGNRATQTDADSRANTNPGTDCHADANGYSGADSNPDPDTDAHT